MLRARPSIFAKYAVSFALLFCTAFSAAQADYKPSPENIKARREFQDMKFGMFIHWGVYSVLGNGEWVFHNRKLKSMSTTGYQCFLIPKNLTRRHGYRWRRLPG